MERPIVEFPWMRMQLIVCIKGLSDKNYQYNEWVLHKGESCEYDDFDITVHFLYDDTDVAENADEYIGLIFINKEEADSVKNVVDKIDIIFDKYGLELSDKEYIEKPEWNDVIEAAKKARSILGEE